LSFIEEDLIKSAVKGLNRVMILWILSRGSLSGYRIIKEMEKLTERSFNSGMIYPLLYDLEEEGLIAGKWAQKGRRIIKYYSITEEGSNALKNIYDLLRKTREIILDFLK